MKKRLLSLLALALIFTACENKEAKNEKIDDISEDYVVDKRDIDERLIEDDEDDDNHGIDDHDVTFNDNSKKKNHHEEKHEEKHDENQGQNIDTDGLLAELNGKKFRFMSGAGGWKTDLFFENSGNFRAEYMDGDYDTIYVNNFSGQFSIDQKLSDTAYILNLDHAQSLTPVGTEEVKNIEGRDMNIIYTDLAYGFAKDTQNDRSFQDKFTLYLPYQKIGEMNDEVKQWISTRNSPYIDDYESRVFILVNNSTSDTFIEEID